MTWSFTISLPSQDIRHSGSGFPDPLGACTYRPCSSLSISAVTASSPSTQSREFDQAVSLGWNSLISWLHSHMSPAVWCFRPDQIPSYIGREWWILITWKDLTCENPSGPSSNRINMITDGCVLTEHRVNGFSLCWLSKLNVCNFFNIRCLWFSQVMKILNCPPAFPSARGDHWLARAEPFPTSFCTFTLRHTQIKEHILVCVFFLRHSTVYLVIALLRDTCTVSIVFNPYRESSRTRPCMFQYNSITHTLFNRQLHPFL